MRLTLRHSVIVFIAVCILPLAARAAGSGGVLDVKPPHLDQPDKSGPIGKRMAYLIQRQFGADLQQQVRFGADSFLPERSANARDGARSRERDVRPFTSLISGGAIVLRFTKYDARNVGRPRAEVEKILLSMISEIADHHIVNNPEKKSWWWGNEWQSALWAADLSRGAWLFWDRLRPDVRVKVARMVVYEADRFLADPAPYNEFNDTKAEENAWNSQLIVLAVAMLPNHPNHDAWALKAKEYMVTAFAAPQNVGHDRVIDGKPLREWLRGPNIHRDYTLENHNMFHPDYLATYGLNVENTSIYRLAGLPVPQSALFNVVPCRNVSKFLTLPTGFMLYPTGTDWSLYRGDIVPHAQSANGFFPDPVGSRCLLWTLDSLARKDNPGQPPTSLVGFNFECNPLRTLSGAYLVYHLFGSGAEPASEQETLRLLSGTRLMPDARMIFCRSTQGAASFSWFDTGGKLCGSVMPMTPSCVTFSGARSLIGILGEKIDPVRVIKREVELLPKGGFSAGLSLERGPDYSVKERVIMLALPDGRVVYGEWLDAASSRITGQIKTGLLYVEDNPFWLRDDKLKLYHPGGAWEGDSADWIVAGDQIPWLNVANRLGIVLRGTKRVYYTKRALSLSYRPADSDEAPPTCLIAVFYPNATREMTAKANEQVRVTTLEGGEVSVALSDVNVILNPTECGGSVNAAQ